MIKTQGLTHIQLAVRDVNRSLKFYQGVFGMEVQYWHGSKMVFLRTPGDKDTITLAQAGKGWPSRAAAWRTSVSVERRAKALTRR